MYKTRAAFECFPHFSNVLNVQSVLSQCTSSFALWCIIIMASSASGQYAANSVFWLATRAAKMEQYCTPEIASFVPANTISPKFKRVHESFLSRKLVSAKVKDFLWFLCLYETRKRENRKRQREWKQKKMLMSFKKIRRRGSGFEMWTNKPIKRLYFLHLSNQDIGVRAIT